MKVTLPSICALDCPDACALQITVEDGKVVKLEGDKDHPITQGFACVKTYRYPERQEHANRLLYPMKRVGKKGTGVFASVSWDEALDGIASRLDAILQSHGAQSILPYCYSGTMGLVEGQHSLAMFRAIGTLELDQTICATTGSAAWEANYGPAKLGPDPEDLIHSDMILLWGINSLRSNSHLTPFLKEARKRGAFILHIDPYRNETSRFADEHWQIRVGTDAALALAIGGEILRNQWEDREYLGNFANDLAPYQAACESWPLERAADYCNIPLHRIQSIAKRFAQARASFIKVGYGMTRNEGGGNAIRAITLLPALVGAWTELGGGAAISTSGGFPLNRHRLGASHLRHEGVRHVNMNHLASELLSSGNQKIQSLVVFNSNPAAVAPDSSRVRKGLMREDLFTVVLEHFQTDTADYADYLLPATTFLEHPDLYTAYGHYYLQWSEPVVPPRGEAKPNTWIFSQLASRLGIDEPSVHWDAQRVARELLDSDDSRLEGITLERLRAERTIKLNLPTPFLPYSNGSHFSDGKIRFSPPPIQVQFMETPSDEFPLRLISPPGAYILNTTMGNIESIQKMAGGQPQVMMHPDDAKSIGVEHLGMARIISEQGSIIRQVIVSTDAAPQTAVAMGQWWPKLAPDGKSLNDLTSERLTDLGYGSTFGNTVVRMEAIPIDSGSHPNSYRESETSIDLRNLSVFDDSHVPK